MNVAPRLHPLLALVALGALVVVGMIRGGPASPPTSAMNNYVIIFRQGPFAFTPELNERRQREIVAWATRHEAAGHHLEPRALDPEVRRPGIAADTAGSEHGPIVALVFLKARDIDEAAAIADDHPAKHYNVSTEVRPWIARKLPSGASP